MLLKTKEKEFIKEKAKIDKQLATLRSKASTQTELLDAAKRALGEADSPQKGGWDGGGGYEGNTFMTDADGPPAGW